MVLESDNRGAVGLVNNFSVGGQTRHMETRQYYLQKLKEQGDGGEVQTSHRE